MKLRHDPVGWWEEITENFKIEDVFGFLGLSMVAVATGYSLAMIAFHLHIMVSVGIFGFLLLLVAGLIQGMR